jgi:hypothetical protein
MERWGLPVTSALSSRSRGGLGRYSFDFRGSSPPRLRLFRAAVACAFVRSQCRHLGEKPEARKGNLTRGGGMVRQAVPVEVAGRRL